MWLAPGPVLINIHIYKRLVSMENIWIDIPNSYFTIKSPYLHIYQIYLVVFRNMWLAKSIFLIKEHNIYILETILYADQISSQKLVG